MSRKAVIQIRPVLAFRLAIGRAAMIDTPRRIPFEIPVQVKFLIQREDAPVLQFATPSGFRLGDFFADIFDDARARRQVDGGEKSLAVNRGRADAEGVVHDRGSMIAPRNRMAPLWLSRMARKKGRSTIIWKGWLAATDYEPEIPCP